MLYFVILFVSCYTSLYFSSVVILRYTFCLLLYICEIIELFWHSCGQEGIVLIEEKSTNVKIASSRAVMKGRTKYKAASCYKIVRSGFGKGGFLYHHPTMRIRVPASAKSGRTQRRHGFAASRISRTLKFSSSMGWCWISSASSLRTSGNPLS